MTLDMATGYFHSQTDPKTVEKSATESKKEPDVKEAETSKTPHRKKIHRR
jgi:hypothetical protein